MSGLSDWRPRPDKINHHWACPRRPVLETVRHGRVIMLCGHCGADDDDRDDGPGDD